MRTRDDQTLTWDAANRLTKVADGTGTLAEFTYADGVKRIKKTEGSTTIVYYNGYWEEDTTASQVTLLFYARFLLTPRPWVS